MLFSFGTLPLTARRSAALALLLAAASVGATGDVPPLLATKLAALAGSGARDCGNVSLGGDRTAAIACAREAAAAGGAYRVAFAVSGVDTYTWQGAARDAQGRAWVIFYDADPAGGPGAAPGLGQLLCRDIAYAADKPEVIDCTPSTGSP